MMEESQQITGKILLKWEAPEYFYHEKSTDWYWWLGLAAIVLLGLAIWQRSFFLGVLVLVAWFTIMLYAVKRPKKIKLAIAERGMAIEKNLYLWPDIDSFWIFYKPPLFNDISLKSKKTLMPYIKVPLGKIDPEKAREILKKFLPEEEQSESMIDNLSHLAKF